MKYTFPILLAVALQSIAPGSLRAQNLESRFKMFDRNGDGKLSLQSEIANQTRLHRADRDGDGFITLKEAQASFGGGSPTPPASPSTPPPVRDYPDAIFQPHQEFALVGSPLAVGVFDHENDGWPDLVFPSARASGKFLLARNQPGEDGKRQFAIEVLSSSDDPRDARKIRTAKGIGLHDFNNDGYLDVYLANSGGDGGPSLGPDGVTIRPANPNKSPDNSVQLNRSGTGFETLDLGIDSRGSQIRSVVFADFDGDGNFDSYHSVSPYYGPGWGGSPIGNELHPGTSDWKKFNPDQIAVSLPDRGFWQDEHGRGIKMTKATLVRDFDGDGKPDLVTGAYADIWGGSFRRMQTPEDAKLDLDKDGTPDTTWPGGWDRGLFILQNISTPGRIQFEEIGNRILKNASSDGSNYPQMHVYSIVAADIDHDADLDLLVNGPRNQSAHRSVEDQPPVVRLLRNDSVPGSIRFTDITNEAGFGFLNVRRVPGYPGRHGVPNLAAGTPIDLENDGDMDFVHIDRLDANPGADRVPWVFENDGTGKFTRVAASVHGLHGHFNDLSLGDFNRDGRTDLVFVLGDPTTTGTGAVFLNQSKADHRWIQIAVSEKANRFGIGSKVTVYKSGTDEVTGYDEVRTDFCYRSKRSPELHFGLGSVTEVDVKVTTRDGRTQRFSGLAADRLHTLELAMSPRASVRSHENQNHPLSGSHGHGLLPFGAGVAAPV